MTDGLVAIGIVLIVFGGITLSVTAFFRLQRHRADAAAMAEYRKFAEEAAVRQQSLDDRLGEFNSRLSAIEKLLKSIE